MDKVKISKSKNENKEMIINSKYLHYIYYVKKNQLLIVLKFMKKYKSLKKRKMKKKSCFR